MRKYIDSAIKYKPDYYEAYKEKSNINDLPQFQKMMSLRKMMQLEPNKDDWVWTFRAELTEERKGVLFFQLKKNMRFLEKFIYKHPDVQHAKDVFSELKKRLDWNKILKDKAHQFNSPPKLPTQPLKTK